MPVAPLQSFEMSSELLSTWNQIAPRVYIRQWYCFPFRQDASIEELEKHLRLALDQLPNYFPYIKKKLYLLSESRGHLAIGPDEIFEIPLQVIDERDSYAWTYDRLRVDGFPAKAFVDASLDLPHQLIEGKAGIPILEIHARVIKGGLFLCLYSHHSISDGTGVNNLMHCFAQLTRYPTKPPVMDYSVDIQLDLSEETSSTKYSKNETDRFQELLGPCNEYCELQSPIGPTQFLMERNGTPVGEINKTGRIFVIGMEKIHQLKTAIAKFSPGDEDRPPSAFTCLAAVTWAHVIKARLSTSREQREPNRPYKEEIAKLLLSINWRRRAFASTMGASAGNAIALPITPLGIDDLLNACSPLDSTGYSSLSKVARAIETTIQSIDDGFIAKRTSLFRSCPDPRVIGVNIDPRDPTGFYFNTWRHFSKEKTLWNLPGVVVEEENQISGVVPDAIRRAQGDWNLGAGLLLPVGRNSDIYELLITLEVDAMEELCADPGWMRWVDRVVE